jgi:hypothetical protein
VRFVKELGLPDLVSRPSHRFLVPRFQCRGKENSSMFLVYVLPLAVKFLSGYDDVIRIFVFVFFVVVTQLFLKARKNMLNLNEGMGCFKVQSDDLN